MSDSFDPDQDILYILIWIKTACNGYPQTAKVAASG